MIAAFASFHQQITHPLKFRLFMLKQLPSAFFTGLRVQDFDDSRAVVTVRYKWFTRNPFRSMYFAVQAMAAEMSTGLLASGHVYRKNPAVSMLVVGLEAKFYKKVTGIVHFTCDAGVAIADTIAASIETGEGKTIRCHSVGKNSAGETVSEFWITWSFKAKRTPARSI